MTAIPEQLTPAAATNRALFASNPSGAAGAPVVILHGLADENGSQLGGSAKALSTADAGLGTDGTSPPSLPGGATGVRGWLRYIGSLLSGTLTVSQTLGGNPVSPSNRLPVEIDANNVTLQIASTVGTAAEASTVAQSLSGLNLLSTQPASSRIGFWYFQNQSGNPLYIALDDGAGNALSVFVDDPGAGTGRQGGDMGSYNIGPHTGRIRVYGPANSQHSIRVQ